ncbi:hypothetical protein HYS54_03780 [Candidatus Micrarchaeota archaeon]|nr:hypothetical protein [Candidatus Micrarchaeota archaeon]
MPAKLKRPWFKVASEPAGWVAGRKSKAVLYPVLRRGQFTQNMVTVKAIEPEAAGWRSKDPLQTSNRIYKVVVRRPGFEEHTVGSFSLSQKMTHGAVSISGFSPWQFDPKHPGITSHLSQAKMKAVSGSGLPDVVLARIEQIASMEGASELRVLPTRRSESFYLRLGFTRKGPYLVKQL